MQKVMIMMTAMGVSTSILPGDMDIMGILLLIFKVIVYGLGVAATVGVVIVGIQYLTARDNEAQVATAKTRLRQVVIGLAAWALMWPVMNWLVPGGMTFDSGGSSSGSGGSPTVGSGESGESGQTGGGSGSQTAESRAEGSESAASKTGNVGSGNEGWVEENS